MINDNLIHSPFESSYFAALNLRSPIRGHKIAFKGVKFPLALIF